MAAQIHFNLFGDDTIQFVHAPDHTEGLVCTLIQRNKHWNNWNGAER
jgi:hypothetical protein